MSAFRVIPLSPALADEVRATGRAPGYGHPAHAETATGYGPCRVCLRTFRTGEERRILFTHDAFRGVEDYPSPGPVFIHEAPCEPFAGPGVPADFATMPLVMEGYAPGRWLVAREPVADGDVAGALARVFAHDAVTYVHVRNREAGCYVARAERAEAPGDA
jgi:hypothetical protein